jgi:tetratricopeptide (TPR) repeat protein
MRTNKIVLSVFIRVHLWLILFLLFSSCSRQPAASTPRRVAILRFENLTADPSLDWMGRAFSEVILGELRAAPDLYIVSPGQIRVMDARLGPRPVSTPGVSAEQPAAVAAGADRIGYGSYWISNGRLVARLVLQDTARTKDTLVLSTPAGDLLGAANALARQISGRAGRYATSNLEAIRAYSAALEAHDPSIAEAQAGLAIAADPDFGPPYLILAQVKSAQDRAGALALLDRALARSGIQPADRAHLEIAAATLRNDSASIERGFAALSKAEPGDPDNWKSLGESAYARRDFRQAMSAWQRAVAIEPEDVNSLNLLAYSAAYAGDLNTATAALRRYASLRPRDTNALDSMGDVYVIAGRLKEAEDSYVRAAKQDANFYNGADWYKAAMARLMTGDVAGADGLAAEFVKARSAAKDPTVPVFQAEWQWISGRRKAAYSALEQFAHASEKAQAREAASRAYAQLAVWSLMLGDRAAAEQMSGKAMATAVPASALEALVARFLAQPPAPAAEWQARAERLVPNPNQQSIRDTVLAYALLLSREYAPAVPALQRLYGSAAGTTSEGLPMLLAWAYLESGRANDAAPLLQFYPSPQITGPGVFTGLYFPRMFELRARVAEMRGDTASAQADRKTLAALGGA